MSAMPSARRPGAAVRASGGTFVRRLLAALPEQDLHLERRGGRWIAFCCNDERLTARCATPHAALQRLAARRRVWAGMTSPATRRVLALVEGCAQLFGERVFAIEHVHGLWSVRWRLPRDHVAGPDARSVLLQALVRWAGAAARTAGR
jgi:hypothetical protein